jgi:hypothetical protein
MRPKPLIPAFKAIGFSLSWLSAVNLPLARLRQVEN